MKIAQKMMTIYLFPLYILMLCISLFLVLKKLFKSGIAKFIADDTELMAVNIYTKVTDIFKPKFQLYISFLLWLFILIFIIY